MRPKATGFQFYIDEDTMQGDGQQGNPIRANIVNPPTPTNPTVAPGIPASPGTLLSDPGTNTLYMKSAGLPTAWIALAGATPPTTTQELQVTPSQASPFFPGTNMTPGYIADWTQPGLQDHTNLAWAGADNEGTVLTGIDSTGIGEGAIRMFVNSSVSGNDVGTVVLLDETDPHVTAGPFASLAANRICTPQRTPYKVANQEVVMLQLRRDSADNVRWFVIAGQTRQTTVTAQLFGFYPHLQVGTPGVPIVGLQSDWAPVGVPYLGNASQLTVDGGDCTDPEHFTFWNIFTDNAGASIGGIAPTPTDAGWGVLRFIYNSGPGVLTLKNLDGGSLPANQLVLPYGRDYVLQPLSGAWLMLPYLDEGLGTNPQWRLMGVSNDTFPSLNTTGRTTTQSLTTMPELSPAALASVPAVTSDFNPGGDDAVINVATNANGSILDGIVPAQPLVGNEIRILRNTGSGPLVILDELSSASAAGNRFTLPGAFVGGASKPIVVAPFSELLIQYRPAFGRWCIAGNGQNRALDATPLSVTPAVMFAGNVNDWAPVDAVTALAGRYASFWRVQGAVGTNLTGIDAAPAGLAPFTHGDRVTLLNLGGGLTIKHSDAGSAAANQIYCPGGADVVLAAYGAVELLRDQLSNAWFLVRAN